jgi:hypothetical protein
LQVPQSGLEGAYDNLEGYVPGGKGFYDRTLVDVLLDPPSGYDEGGSGGEDGDEAAAVVRGGISDGPGDNAGDETGGGGGEGERVLRTWIYHIEDPSSHGEPVPRGDWCLFLDPRHYARRDLPRFARDQRLRLQ